MPNADISRYLKQPGKHYKGARLQQGRSLLDSDFNEGAEVSHDDRREALLDVVGTNGSPDQGFLPDLRVGDMVTSKLVRFGAFTQAYVLDYPLKSGVMYTGGIRWEQPELEPVIFQREFLQMGAATAPRAALGQQRQLSCLRGWEQSVTAVEDAEIIEPALGGADAATRVRRMRRVEVHNVQSSDCAGAFAEVLKDLGDGDTVAYDPTTGELRSNARLRMTFQGFPAADCAPCEPSLEGRYLGGENHTIRIMLAGPDRYVWAFDNAAPLYRVRLVLDGGGGARVDMLTPPKDTFHYPRQNTVVEFLPWEALLENGWPRDGQVTGANVNNQKVAARAGFFAEANGPYDPSVRCFHVRLAPGSALQLGVGSGKTGAKAESQATTNLKTGSVPTQDGIAVRWDNQHPFADQLNFTDSGSDGFVAVLYMRVWHEKQPDAPLTIPTSSNKPLGQTGLVPVFTGRGRLGDFWTIAVRPDAPDEILPREIMQEGGVPPHGPHEVIAPISLVTWGSTFGTAHQVIAIEDCRPALPSLIDRGCCTYEVGPGGDFETIQAAVNALPLSGGRICIQPGVYREEIQLTGRSNVVLAGCGERTLIISPEEVISAALVNIELAENERKVRIHDLALQARGQIGIRASGGDRIEFSGLSLMAIGTEIAPPQSAIRAIGVTDIRITGSRIEMDGAFSHHAAVYIDCPRQALVKDNTIETRHNQENGFSYAWGGIQVAGGSRDIEICGNVIRGGRGPGIGLGSVEFRGLDGRRLDVEGAGRGQSNLEPPFAVTGMIRPVTVFDDQNPNQMGEFFPEPQAAIEEIIISENLIENMGGSGIASLALQVDHDDRATGPPLCYRRTTFAVTNLILENNRILNNARQPVETAGDRFALGGIILSEVSRATLRGNLIEENGVGQFGPVCGIGIAYGEDILIVSNRIRDNGVLPDGVPPPTPGAQLRGGIVIRPPANPDQASLLDVVGPRNVHLRRNGVDQPDALAVLVLSRGACRIMGNHFHSYSRNGRIIATSVMVFNAGKAWEAVDLAEGEPNPDRWTQPQGSNTYLNGPAQELPGGDGGALCFNGNQVTTIGVGTQRAAVFGALLISTDHTSVIGNQFALRSLDDILQSHVLVVGLTTDVSGNRVAETLESTPISLAAMAPMLTVCAGNQLTHCPAVFGCANHNNADYFLEDDNLVWFRPREGRCEEPARPVLVTLRGLCTTLFERSRGRTPNIFRIGDDIVL
jgi:hypothetical protein